MAQPGPLVLREASLRGKDDAGGGLVRLVLAPPLDLVGSYVRPGQYVVLRADGKSAYFVLAGDPGDPSWMLLVRPVGEAAAAALGGSPVLVSEAHGAGFPMDEAQGRELIVAVTGSGIAAARPVLRARVLAGEGKATQLFVGVRTREDLALGEELTAWGSAGATVVVCLSRETAPPGAAGYATGYVQDVARARAAPASGARRMIFAAGVKPMIEAVRALARDMGAEESDVRTNY
jgi:NAD(P)H-flavin reductase